MTTYYSQETTGTLDGTQPGQLGDASSIRGKVHTTFATFNLANMPQLQIGDQLVVGRLHTNMRVRNARVVSSVTLGASTIALGSVTLPNKYRAPATNTTPDVPQDGLPTAVTGVQLTAPETVVATIGAAAMPAAGLLVIAIDVVLPHSN